MVIGSSPDVLDYLHARYYNPQLGRFLSPDPLRSSDRSRPQSWNKYSYAPSNPMRFVDPKGETVESALGQITEYEYAAAIHRRSSPMPHVDGHPAFESARGCVAPLRLLVFLTSAALAALAYPASKAKVLLPNDDSLCVLVGVLLFGAVAVSALAIKKKMPITLAAFLAALLLQAWALHWVESGPFLELAFGRGTTPLRLWALIYILSWLEVGTVAVAVWRRVRPRFRRSTSNK